jgi:hypothetical protein
VRLRPLRPPDDTDPRKGGASMEPKNLKDMEVGSTLMLASEIQERTSISQVYEKVDDSTVKHYESGETVSVPPDEIVYPFEPSHAAKRV